MTHLIEILLIVSIITSVIMLMLLIILKVGVTSDKRENRETRKSQVVLETQTEGWRFFWIYYADGIVRNSH